MDLRTKSLNLNLVCFQKLACWLGFRIPGLPLGGWVPQGRDIRDLFIHVYPSYHVDVNMEIQSNIGHGLGLGLSSDISCLVVSILGKADFSPFFWFVGSTLKRCGGQSPSSRHMMWLIAENANFEHRDFRPILSALSSYKEILQLKVSVTERRDLVSVVDGSCWEMIIMIFQRWLIFILPRGPRQHYGWLLWISYTTELQKKIMNRKWILLEVLSNKAEEHWAR